MEAADWRESGGEAETKWEAGCFLSRWREPLGAEADDVKPAEALEGVVDDFGPMQGVIDLGGRWTILGSVRQMGAKTGGNDRRSGSGRT